MEKITKTHIYIYEQTISGVDKDLSYEYTFRGYTSEGAQLYGELLQMVADSNSQIEVSITINSDSVLPISTYLHISNSSDHESNDTVVTNTTNGNAETEQPTESAGTEVQRPDEPETPGGEPTIDTDEIPTFHSDSKTVPILRAVDNVGGEWVMISELRDSFPDDGDVNVDNLSKLLWSYAEDGYLKKQKNGGMNEYRLSESGRAGLDAH